MQTHTILKLAGVRADVRDEVDRWNDAFENINGPVTHAFEEIAAALGASVNTVKGKYYAWLKTGRLALVNKAKCPGFEAIPADDGVSEDTFEYYRQLCRENGRKCLPAYKKMVREFFAGM